MAVPANTGLRDYFQRLSGLQLVGAPRRQRHFYLRGLDELRVSFDGA